MLMLIGGGCLFLGVCLFALVAFFAVQTYLAKAKARGVNVFDGIDPEELQVLHKIFREMRQSELQVRVKQKLQTATAEAAATPLAATPKS